MLAQLGYAQSNRQALLPDGPKEMRAQGHQLPGPHWQVQRENPLPVQEKPVSSAAKVMSVNPVQIGRSTNVFSILRPQQNQIVAVDSLNLVTFIHRQDITVWGGGNSASSILRADISTDGGTSFSPEWGPLNGVTQYPVRYPQAVLHNPQNNNFFLDKKLVYSGSVLNGGNWSGYMDGTARYAQTNFADTLNNYQILPDAGIMGGLCNGLPGEFWQADQMVSPTLGTVDTIRIHKGVWNATTQTVDWSIAHKVTPNWNKSFDGSIYSIAPNMAFSPDGQTGYVALLGDLVGGADSVYSPIFIRTVDGGQTWGNPVEVNLNQFPWVADSLRKLWVVLDPQTGLLVPASSGIATTAFDFDITVDAAGNPHLAVVIGTAGSGTSYSFASGLSKYLLDVSSPNAGQTWTAQVIAPVLTFRGTFGSANPETMDNHPQISRSPDGNHIFFSWVDSDTAAVTFNMNGIGFGMSDNLAPNLRIAGLRITDAWRTCYKLITDLDFVWESAALWPTMAPEVLVDANGFKLPIVIPNLITGDPTQSVDFHYFGNDARIDNMDFAPNNLNLAWGSGCQGQGGGQLPLLSRIDGMVWADTNANGIMDGGEYGIPGIPITAQPGNYLGFTNAQGNYSIPVPYGTYTVGYNGNPPSLIQSFPTNPNVYTAATTTGNPVVNGLDFGFDFVPGIRNLAVIVTYPPHRPGITVNHHVTVLNLGTTTESDTVGYRYDSLLSFVFSAPMPYYNQGDSLAWAFNLGPFQSVTYSVNFAVDQSATIGDSIYGNATVGANGDSFEPDNRFQYVDPVLNSFDPNDKTAFPLGPHQNEIITDSTWLYYRIRFQNTGTAPAIDVRIEDTLTSNLDYSSLQMIDASHPNLFSTYWNVFGKLVMTWRFDGINLPDSFSNEPASHGWINFRVKPFDNTPLGTEIENTAYIYFDFNPPVITNTTYNRVDIFTALPDPTSEYALKVYPNPFTEGAIFEFERAPIGGYDFQLFDISGKLLRQEQGLEGARYQMEGAGIQPGMYFYRITQSGRMIARGKLLAR